MASGFLASPVDTNIWISAARSPNGAPGQVVRRVLTDGLAEFSTSTFAELEVRLWRPKYDRYLSVETRRKMLGDAQSDALWVEMPHEISTVPHCRDADDDMFIRGGLAASVRWLVAGDSDFLAVPAMDELKILTAHEALTADNCCSQS